MASYVAGFICAGNMGGALAVAAVKQVGGARVAVTCSTPEHTASTAARLDCRPETAENILANSRFVFLGVKPQAVSGVLAGLTEAVASSEAVLVSMLAGVTLERLADLLGADKKIIRIMPNTPCTVEEGLILYAANDRVSGEELDAFRGLMRAAGVLDELPEHLIDAASAVSGCGPAYAYLFIEALADGGVKCGLPRSKAIRYAAQMLRGSAALVLQSGKHPELLRTRCAAPAAAPLPVWRHWRTVVSGGPASPPWRRPASARRNLAEKREQQKSRRRKSPVPRFFVYFYTVRASGLHRSSSKPVI